MYSSNIFVHSHTNTSGILNIMYPAYYVVLLILYAHYPVALCTFSSTLFVIVFFVLFRIFHIRVIILL